MTTQSSLEARFAARMGSLLGPDFPSDIALAVSGGGDSMAMLALSHGWARVMGVGLHVLTVDHGLRPASATEAAMVAAECASLGHPHTTLCWHWDGSGNLQDAARMARLRLIDGWRGDIVHVLFAHTQDDQAETLMMRLARGSGVEGLSGMSGLHPAPGAGFWQVRPLLDEARADLRHYADTLRLPVVDDPSNDDPRFERVRARQALAILAGLGIDAATLAATAARMDRARVALAARAASVAGTVVRHDNLATGDLVLDRDSLAGVERDTQLRLLAAALQWVGGAVYRPRAAALEGLLDRVLGGAGGTLHGVQASVAGDLVHLFREYASVRDVATMAGTDALWDDRWQIAGASIDGLAVRALGPDGWAQVSTKPADAPPFDVALALPAVFDADRLVACAALALGPAHEAVLLRPAASFVAFLQLR
ncbi:tRNA lysidine(34) synthetase TilS [Roseicyclus mahoneyensis]|uniref:tRNA(Ile)-lysidine synthase n=1 Tax=Roseicyclus mahoneyensis TaxID=164332 RepID=A0A316GEM3_9RHOB|nr:tRNA lysidine(34) synthetase TilS [Roseicyclus mahoneyensis]PWK59394.1 tRNA(Ile)-lysidine synthase [Roseicyclus mahoneyensis]